MLDSQTRVQYSRFLRWCTAAADLSSSWQSLPMITLSIWDALCIFQLDSLDILFLVLQH